MEPLLYAIFRAFRSLFAPGMFSVMLLSVAATIAVLIGFVGFSTAGFSWLAAHLHAGFLASFLPLIGGLGAGLIAWFLFPGIMPVIVSFFDNRIVNLIEQQEYPVMKL